MAIRLTPAGRLRWEPSGDEAAPAGPPSLQDAFETDWREALFTLAAEKTPTRDLPSVRYWQQLADRHLTGLCHVPEDAESFEVEPPTSADCAHWILTAPPMQGGEYLCEETLQRIWDRLDGWVRETVARTGGLAAFLRERAPKWRQVGRVCFHLADAQFIASSDSNGLPHYPEISTYAFGSIGVTEDVIEVQPDGDRLKSYLSECDGYAQKFGWRTQPGHLFLLSGPENENYFIDDIQEDLCKALDEVDSHCIVERSRADAAPRNICLCPRNFTGFQGRMLEETC